MAHAKITPPFTLDETLTFFCPQENVESLTGKWLGIDFLKRIRPQKRFQTEQTLKEQIAKDCDSAKNICKPEAKL